MAKVLLSSIYNIIHRNRGKARLGFIRPTVGEHFMSNRDFVEIKRINKADTYFIPFGYGSVSSDKLTVTCENWQGAFLVGAKTSGKWYAEFQMLTTNHCWIGVVDPDTGKYSYNSLKCIFASSIIGNSTYKAFSVNATSGRYYIGDVVGWNQWDYVEAAYDFDTATYSFYVNGVLTASVSHTNPENNLTKITFSVIGYQKEKQMRLTPNENSVHYPISGYEYFGEILE